MIKVEGKMNTAISITPDVAINALFEDYNLHKKDIESSDKEISNQIFNALIVLKDNYSKIVGNKDLKIISVFDSATTSFYIEGIDALGVLYNRFENRAHRGRKLCTSEYLKKEEKGVYSYEDVSYYGSPMYEYNLIYKGLDAEKLFNAFKFLVDNYYDFTMKQEKGNTRVR